MKILELKIVSMIRYIALGLVISTFISCKKEDVDPFDIDKSKVYLSDSYENNLRDSVWYYYKVLSLWQDVIPPYKNDINKIDEVGFIRENYTKYFEKAGDVLAYLMSLTKNKVPNRSPEKNYDWYSFIDRGGSVSSEIQGTLTSGLGMSVFYLQTTSSGDNADLYIRYVEKNSAAELAGLQRADKILSINGDTKIDYDSQKAKEFSTLINYLNSSMITVKVLKSNGDIVEKVLNYRSYTSSPILLADVINYDQNKVGYLLFNSFASITINGSYTVFFSELEKVFSKFEQQNINELVIDLRYNGGGDVFTAEYLANRIAPSSETGKTMYTYDINSTLKGWGWLNDGEEFATVKFNKYGSLNLSKVYFLVSPNTASASELLINSLKPAMTTYLIGTNSVNDKNVEVADKTYGKPVGFFEIKVVNDQVGLYVSSFKMYNRNGEGDYFDGLTPTTNVWEFRSFKNFGEQDESMLAAALNHIKTGSFSTGTSLKASRNMDSFGKASFIKDALNSKINKDNTSMFKFKKENIKKK